MGRPECRHCSVLTEDAENQFISIQNAKHLGETDCHVVQVDRIL